MDDTVEPEPEDDVAGMLLTITADPESWLPVILFALPAGAEDIQDGLLPMIISPQVAYQIAGGLIQAANMVSEFQTELADKSLEERREILLLESSLVNSPFPLP